MKKRIFIAIHYLEIGGAEISLIGLLNAIDRELYDVDLFLYSHRGELLKQVPDKINLLPEIKKYDVIEKPIKEAIQKGFPDIALARLLAKYQFTRYAQKISSKKARQSCNMYSMRLLRCCRISIQIWSMIWPSAS